MSAEILRRAAKLCPCGKGGRLKRGMCNTCYKRWARQNPDLIRKPRTPQQRFWEKVDKTSSPNGCWLWTGYRGPYGHGTFHWYSPDGRKQHQAHRVAYEWLVGPILDDLVLDHLCRTPPCVNPAHLQPVTNGENVKRGYSNSMLTGRTGICQRGHVMTEENTYLRPDGTKRLCRQCIKLRNAKRYREERP